MFLMIPALIAAGAGLQFLGNRVDAMAAPRSGGIQPSNDVPAPGEGRVYVKGLGPVEVERGRGLGFGRLGGRGLPIQGQLPPGVGR